MTPDRSIASTSPSISLCNAADILLGLALIGYSITVTQCYALSGLARFLQTKDEMVLVAEWWRSVHCLAVHC